MNDIPSPGETLDTLFEQAAQAVSMLHRDYRPAYGAATISFLYGGRVYISPEYADPAGIDKAAFSCVTAAGAPLNNQRPPALLPLHLAMYRQRGGIFSVIYTRATYASLWSCVSRAGSSDSIPAHLPHLASAVGAVPCVECGIPQSDDQPFANGSMAYLLKNDGVIAGGGRICEALRNISLIEEAARLAWIIGGGSRMEFPPLQQALDKLDRSKISQETY